MGTITPGYDTLTSGALPSDKEEVRGFADFSDVEEGDAEEGATGDEPEAGTPESDTQAVVETAEISAAQVSTEDGGEELAPEMTSDTRDAVEEAAALPPTRHEGKHAGTAVASTPSNDSATSDGGRDPKSQSTEGRANEQPPPALRPGRVPSRLQKERDAARIRAERAASVNISPLSSLQRRGTWRGVMSVLRHVSLIPCSL
jgi:hypothetical protein